VRRWLLALAVLASTVALPAPAHAAAPGWITSCQYSHENHDDPIVFPNQPGAAHLHTYVGATTTDADSTPGSLRAGGTTCLMPDDASAYWVPAMYVGNQQILPTGTGKHALFYYRRKGAPPGVTVRTIPDGLKMVIGNAHAQSPADNPQLGSDIIFKCGPGSGIDLDHPPAQCSSSGVLSVSIRFPNCWDGERLDSPNHRSHMAYPVGSSCPATHPVVLPRLESFFRYDVGNLPLGNDLHWSSGPWYTVHQDFLNAWVPSGLQHFVTTCINAMKDCGKNPT